MLVLTRHKDESIIIGDNIELMVVEVRGDKVKIGINAPPEVRVYRKEIYDAIQQENIEAARTPTPDLATVEELLRAGLHTQEEQQKAPKKGDAEPDPAAPEA